MKISMRTQQNKTDQIGSQIVHERMLPIGFQGQMSMATLTIDKYRNNLVGIRETKPIYLDQTCDT